MRNSEKILKTLSDLIENGILTSKDIKDEISTDLKFKRDKIINKLDLVSKEEFEVLKKIVQKQDLVIKKILKSKKTKKAKKS
jgi:BMFP domain-containing protein YqiC